MQANSQFSDFTQGTSRTVRHLIRCIRVSASTSQCSGCARINQLPFPFIQRTSTEVAALSLQRTVKKENLSVPLSLSAAGAKWTLQ